MLTMSHSLNASDRGSSWKESYRSSADSVESSEDSDNSSTNSSLNGGSRTNSQAHLPPPIGCITTHCVSAVIRPERKMPPIDPLQFVKIQKNELSKKAVEQIKLAEEVKITKEKIKEVEEEWQNNLMNWKSKRKLTKTNSEDETMPRNPNRKTKTFSEILNEKARLGARIGYNLHKYIGPEIDEDDNNNINDLDDDLHARDAVYDSSELEKSDSNSENETTTTIIHSSNMENNNINTIDNEMRPSNLDRFLNTSTTAANKNINNNVDDVGEEQISRNGLGEVVVYNTSLLEEFSVKSDNCDNQNFINENNINDSNIINDKNMIDTVKNTNNNNIKNETYSTRSQNESPHQPIKVHVPINDWKSSHSPSATTSTTTAAASSHQRKHSATLDDDQLPQNSSFENDDDDELDEELEKLRIDQERSFKAKLQTFEILAKQEEEAAKRAAEANRKRIQNRAKLAAERSKSLSNISSNPSQSSKHILESSNSVSSSSLQQQQQHNNNNESDSIYNNKNIRKKQHSQQQSSKITNNTNENDEDSYYQLYKNAQTNSVIYNFKDKQSSIEDHSQKQPIQSAPIQKIQNQQQQQIQKIPKSQLVNEPVTKSDHTHLQPTPTNNIYENVPSLTAATAAANHQTPIIQTTNTFPTVSPLSPSEPNVISDSDAIRNASQKLLQQQQQIYQNQPPLMSNKQQIVSQYANNNNNNNDIQQQYSNLPPNLNYTSGYSPEILDDTVTAAHRSSGGVYKISDDVGLPPVQITKSIQSMVPSSIDEQQQQLQSPVYQNQIMVQPQHPQQIYHNYDNSYNHPGTILMPNTVRLEELVGSAYPQQPLDPFQQLQQPLPPSSPQNMNQYLNSQYLYYPKPYASSVGPNGVPKPMVAKQQQPLPQNPARIVPPNPNRYGANGYNPNHWVIQEAELRQSAQRQLQQQQQQQQQQQVPIPIPPPGNKNGYLSVSGKKKCSKCGEELGKGCAAMVVESLSLYYHINCFRCSVCNIQLGNGTVGTDVRVRNQKLHCQNCYSNDEAGLKFSRV